MVVGMFEDASFPAKGFIAEIQSLIIFLFSTYYILMDRRSPK
jgi:hypothetical protein